MDGLLTLARADAGEVRIASETVDLGEVVMETADMLRPVAEKAGVTLEAEANETKLEGDRNRLGEMVSGLVTNAIRYNSTGGRVDVSLRRDGNEAVLEVKDTGKGIPEKHLPHIFERFYRVDPARTREAGGSGLGLSIVKWIVDEHGGTVSVESREGRGSAFTVRLPV
ncbi:MAG: sensor histidine kinase [Planctomycetota bacterium]